MKVQRWQIEIAALMLLLTAAFYTVRWVIFPGVQMHNEMLRFLVGDIAFLFLEVLLVTVFIDRGAREREREDMRQKLNMIVGAFFSEMGTELLGRLASSDGNLASARQDLVPRATWKPQDYARARRAFGEHDAKIDVSSHDLDALKESLTGEKPYLLGLLGNQSLLEHEEFTDLLWAITHLAEELDARQELSGLPQPDATHLAGDVKRAYAALGGQYLHYLEHLQTNYPYLFSLAARTNPLDPEARVAVSA